MSNLRSKFEEIPEIKSILSDGEVYFDNSTGEYVCIRQDDGGLENSLNLSKKIHEMMHNSMERLISSIEWNIEDFSLNDNPKDYDKGWNDAFVKIKELLND